MKLFEPANLKFDGIYRAKVYNNVDPSSLGRCQLEVFGVIDSMPVLTDYDNLPWAKPAFPLGMGGAGVTVIDDNEVSYGSFCVPDIGSFVFVFFENGDMYQPVYFAEASTAKYGLPAERLTSYPATKVWKTKSGVVMTVDSAAGRVTLTVPENYTIAVSNDCSITVGKDCSISVKGDCNIEAEGDVKVIGDTVSINPL